jgi:uncharacterized protein YqgC (DUF456 family)
VSVGPLGLLVGAVIGAVVGALYEGKSIDKAGKVALFSLLGVLGAKIVQLVLALSVIVAFILAVFI